VTWQFTLVQYIPEWLPWLSYKPLARHGYDLGQEVMNGPMSFVRESIVSIRTSSRVQKLTFHKVNGTAQPSLALESLQEIEKLTGREREEAEKVVTGTLGSMYAGK
jgi:hypothetical protein